MIKIRLLIKTHYQISRPGIFSVLINNCVSPSKPAYPEVVSQRLATIGFKTISINKESAKFAVTMARAFNFINDNMFFDWKGRAINILSEETKRESVDEYIVLTTAEKILFLKYYLETDGAAILEICKLINSKKEISRQEILSKNIIDDVFINIWDSYRELTADLQQSIELNENIKKRKSNPYTYKTRIHKALAHIEPLIDFGLLSRKDEKNQVIFYSQPNQDISPVKKLVDELESIKTMEGLFSKFQEFKVIGNIYNLNPIIYNSKIHSELLWERLISTYLKLRIEPSKLADIMTISDIISSIFLAEKRILVQYSQVLQEMDDLRLRSPRDIHFHLDRIGRKTYVVFSDKICEKYGVIRSQQGTR